MKIKTKALIFFLLPMIVLLTGCEVVETIFGAGFWLGIIVSALVVVLVIWLLVKLFRKK